MRKYDLSKIMRRAHEIKKQDSKNIWSICLKMAWAEAKNPVIKEERIPIAYWFQNKLAGEYDAQVYGWDSNIIRETEKAVMLNIRFQTSYGRDFSRKCWVPKSVLKQEEYKPVENKGLNYNELLVRFGKEHGIKGVRVGLKTKTLIKKIAAAGYEVPERD